MFRVWMEHVWPDAQVWRLQIPPKFYVFFRGSLCHGFLGNMNHILMFLFNDLGVKLIGNGLFASQRSREDPLALSNQAMLKPCSRGK